MKSDLEFRDLEAFAAVAETGSFTAAAEALYLTQPTVSARIAALEAALGGQVFDRGARRAELTPAGRVLLPQARSLLKTRKRALDEVRTFLSRGDGVLDVAASTIPGSYLLPPLLARLREERPRLEVRFAIDDTAVALESVRRGEVELAVVGSAVREKGLVANEVGRDEIVLVASRDLARTAGRERRRGEKGARRSGSRATPLRPGDLEGLPLVLREPGSATRRLALRFLEEAGVGRDELRVVLELGSNAGVLEAACAGLGGGFISRLAARDALATGRLVSLDVVGLPLHRPLVLVRRSGRTLSPGAAALVRLLRRSR